MGSGPRAEPTGTCISALFMAFAMLAVALTTPLADGAFVQSGSILSGDAFSDWTAAYTPTDGGTDSISVTVGGGAVSGSPFTSVIGTTAVATTDPTSSGGSGGGNGTRSAGPASSSPVEDPVAPVAPIQLTTRTLPALAPEATPAEPTPPSLTEEELQQGMGGLDLALLVAIISVGLSTMVVQSTPLRVRLRAATMLDPKFLRDNESVTRSLDLAAGAPTTWVPMLLQALETRGGLANLRMIGSSFLSDTGSLARGLMIGTDPVHASSTRRRQIPDVLPPMSVVKRVDDMPASAAITTEVVRIDGPKADHRMTLRERVRSGPAETDAPGDVDVVKVDGPVPQETGSSRRWVSVGSDGVPRTRLEAVPQEVGHDSGDRDKSAIRSPTHPNDATGDDEDVL